SRRAGIWIPLRKVKVENSLSRNVFLRGDAEQLTDEFHRGDHISFACPSHSALSYHAHRLNASQGPPRCPHRPITLRQPGSAFYIAVILRHHVVQVFALSQLAASSHGAVLLQLVHRCRVGRSARPAPIGGFQRPPAALIQLRPVSLHPTPHTTRADRKTFFPGHLPRLCHRDGLAEIPAHTPHDNVAWIVSTFER